MTNFDFLFDDSQFSAFASTAAAAEKVFHVDLASSAVGCRRAMEFAVKWMYSVDKSLVMPWQDKLVTLLHTDAFRDIVGGELFKRLEFIRMVGNSANHNAKNVTRDQALLALENLHAFMDFIAYCYGADYHKSEFNRAFLKGKAPAAAVVMPAEPDWRKVTEANVSLAEGLTERREERGESYSVPALDLTEAATRKAYIDVMLTTAGWTRGMDWFDEYRIDEMPNKSGEGFADYVLFNDDGAPLAVIEAKRTSLDPSKGRQQAKLYADWLERKFGRRPVIFLTNGYETRIWIDQDRGYPERAVSGIYSKRDLQKEFNKMALRRSLKGAVVDEHITNRYYQIEAIHAVCEAFDGRNRRKALLVMATGSGKTRTAASLVKLLMERGWVKNFLFLADRNSLVIQAKRSFVNMLPDLPTTNLTEERDNREARGVFSTYQTMIGCIDGTLDEKGGRLYTPGHFDLIILDEAHRSIYNKYRDIFRYFDALLVGLTATPKDEVDRSTYDVFELESGVPTYGYELAQAVQDHFLVNYHCIEMKTKFLDEGIIYDDLSEAEKAEYEDKFADREGHIPESIGSSALNSWIFNRDTIRQVLDCLMTRGLKVDYGTKIGKSVIFARSHLHAEKILEVWSQEYANYPAGYCRVIDNYTNYAQSLIDDFSNARKTPQIAISVDMLDTGIDVPEILNLVFFKKVLSKSKFWQMIGRGTRLCPKLIDGEDKSEFYIFDCCSNFQFFRVTARGKDATGSVSLQESLFNLKLQLAFRLQNIDFQTDELVPFRKGLVAELVKSVSLLDRDSFAVQLHRRYVDLFSGAEHYQALSYENILDAAEHVAPLLPPEEPDPSSARFDLLLYGIELGCLIGKGYSRGRNDLTKKLRALADYGSIPEVAAQKDFIKELLESDFIKEAGVVDFESIRRRLRSLMKYVEREPSALYDTDFADPLKEILEGGELPGGDGLESYKEKVNHYICAHDDMIAIMKLKSNQPLTSLDVKELERILWSELGTKDDYARDFKNKPLGELIRSIVGLDQGAAKAAFAKYLNRTNLTPPQAYFVNQIINYIVKNGVMKDFGVMSASPFSDRGSAAEIFTDPSVWNDIVGVIDRINANAELA